MGGTVLTLLRQTAGAVATLDSTMEKGFILVAQQTNFFFFGNATNEQV
jgi:hypothetical protein